jgi:hypothetical protein
MKRFKIIKSMLEIFAVLFLSVLPWTPIVAANPPIAVIVDGQAVTLDQPAIMSQGRVMVPLRGIFERLGATVNYDSQKQTVMAIRGTDVITLVMNSTQATVNGTPTTLDVPPLMMGSRILVPLRFVSEALGADVKWQAYNQTVTVLSRTGGADLPYPPLQQPYNTPNQQPIQSNQPFQLGLTAPAPASALSPLSDISGTTQPNAIVHINVISDMPRHGFLGTSSPNSVVVLDTTTRADSLGKYVFHIDTSNLASGAHIVVTMSASNTTGGSSNELRVEYSRQ